MAATEARTEVKPAPADRTKQDGACCGACSDDEPLLSAAVDSASEHRRQNLKLKLANCRGQGLILGSVLSRIFVNITAELFRVLSMQLVLAPAAYLLPRSCAFAIAKGLSLSLIMLPSPGVVTYWHMRRAFRRGRLRSVQLAWRSVARPFEDFVMCKRILYGREDVSRWRILERNVDEVAGLRQTGQSFIIATAHFHRAALLALACPSVTPGNLITVGHPPPSRIRSPFHLRLRFQYGTMLKALSSAWRRPSEFVFTGSGQSAASLIYERLRAQGNIVSIHVDAPWERSLAGSYSRPFAGLREREFSTGAAQLAALTGCPIVSCVYWRRDDDTVILEWGSPCRAVDDATHTMDQVLDDLEVAVGERPAHYMYYVGGQRRWNESLRRWEDLAA